MTNAEQICHTVGVFLKQKCEVFKQLKTIKYLLIDSTASPLQRLFN